MQTRQKPAGDSLRVLVWVLIAVLCVGAAALIVVVLSCSGLDQTSAETIATALALSFFSLTAAAGTNLVLRRPRLAAIGYLAAAVSLAAFVTFEVSLWAELGEGKPIAYSILAAFAAGHSAVLLTASAKPGHRLRGLVGLGTSLALWGLVALGAADIAEYENPPVGAETLAVFAVLLGLGTLVLLLLSGTDRASRVLGGPEPLPPPGTEAISLDHMVIGVSDWERSNAFYRDVLGAKLVTMPGGRFAYRIGDQQLNPHGPGTEAVPLAAQPVRPGNSDLCFTWGGTAEGAVDYLQRRGVAVEMGPVQRTGARGDGNSVYFRDPDGSLIELIAYS